jgi:hypothetical protein
MGCESKPTQEEEQGGGGGVECCLVQSWTDDASANVVTMHLTDTGMIPSLANELENTRVESANLM